MEKEYHKCSKELGFCPTLADRIEGACFHGKGMVPLTAIDGNAIVGSGMAIKTLGIMYKTSAKDRGLMFNHCPFCGEKIDWFREGREEKSEAVDGR